MLLIKQYICRHWFKVIRRMQRLLRAGITRLYSTQLDLFVSILVTLDCSQFGIVSGVERVKCENSEYSVTCKDGRIKPEDKLPLSLLGVPVHPYPHHQLHHPVDHVQHANWAGEGD